jgi:hypothetical protein
VSATPSQKAFLCLITATLVAGATTGGCSRKSDATPSGSASSSASAPAASAKPASEIPRPIPLTQAQIDSTVNPTKLPAYKGPTGTIRGNISVRGDRAPEREDVIATITPKCQAAKEMYGKLFREGMMRSLADALVTVTGYDGYVPARSTSKLVEARNCSWDSRTIALMFGQRLDVQSKDSEPYLPDLIGGSMPAQMVAIPGREPVTLYPMKVGRYGLGDTLHPFSFADVFVIKYPTFAVTGLDGKYEITGVPVGEVTVTAVLPITMRTAEKKVKVEPDRAILVDLEIPFDKKKDMPKPPPKPKEEKGKRKAPIIH